MNSVPHHAQKGNSYLIYVLTEHEQFTTWSDVKYVGLTNNALRRYAQHVYGDRGNAQKAAWTEDLLRQGKTPHMFKVEEDIQSQKLAREREQCWIRYALSQGAKLLNRAISYTEKEREEAQQWRIERYAQIAALLAQGIYVKRCGPHHYPNPLIDPYLGERYATILNANTIYFETAEGKRIDLEHATDDEFDIFIRQFVEVKNNGCERWYLQERCFVLNFACYFEKLAMRQPEGK